LTRLGGAHPIELAGLGASVVIEAHGPERLRLLERKARELLQRLQPDPSAPAFAAPRLLGGFAFRDEALSWDGFASARLVLPQVLVIRRENESWVTCIDGGQVPELCAATPRPLPRLRPTGGESGRSFRDRVAEARAAILRGPLRKVVLARAVELRAEEPVSAFSLAAALAHTQSGCLIYALRTASGTGFAGATPELLVRRLGRRIESRALAGTSGPGAGCLRSSLKDHHEHALVVEAIRSALEPVAALGEPGPPEVLELLQVEHLLTRIQGELTEDRSALDLARRLHPTPAVGGTPRDTALEWLAKHEPLDRGWYCGGVGWLGLEGDGEFSVALRCARLDGADVSLYAGAGIVERSDPEAEWIETGLKLRAVLSCFPD
jgi:menaquinone-specific isochorismate synthase